MVHLVNKPATATSESLAAEVRRLREENQALTLKLQQREPDGEQPPPPPPNKTSSSEESMPLLRSESAPTTLSAGTHIDVSVLARTSVRLEVGDEVTETLSELLEERRKASELTMRASYVLPGLFGGGGGGSITSGGGGNPFGGSGQGGSNFLALQPRQ